MKEMVCIIYCGYDSLGLATQLHYYDGCAKY